MFFFWGLPVRHCAGVPTEDSSQELGHLLGVRIHPELPWSSSSGDAGGRPCLWGCSCICPPGNFSLVDSPLFPEFGYLVSGRGSRLDLGAPFLETVGVPSPGISPYLVHSLCCFYLEAQLHHIMGEVCP